jgi:hypothetical protein
MLGLEVLIRANVSEELSTAILRVLGNGEVGKR